MGGAQMGILAQVDSIDRFHKTGKNRRQKQSRTAHRTAEREKTNLHRNHRTNYQGTGPRLLQSYNYTPPAAPPPVRQTRLRIRRLLLAGERRRYIVIKKQKL